MILKVSYTAKNGGTKEPGTKGWIWYDNVLTASCYFSPQYGCTVINIWIKNQVDPTEIPLRETAYLCNDEGKTIEAFYPEILTSRPPTNPKATEQIKCSNCKHSHKVDDITYKCDAKEYDIDTLSCFVPK